jgi:hypothetical protein
MDRVECPARRAVVAGTVSLAVTAALPVRASIAPPEIAAELPAARLVGSGTLRFLGLPVYDARLWAPRPLADTDYASVPLALELEYARRLVGRLIAERSITEMRRIGTFDDAKAERWQAQLAAIFPDVERGDRITGVQHPGRAARFFVNGRAAGEVRDAEFTRLFFGIWLAPQTSQPQLRAALLGA